MWLDMYRIIEEDILNKHKNDQTLDNNIIEDLVAFTMTQKLNGNIPVKDMALYTKKLKSTCKKLRRLLNEQKDLQWGRYRKITEFV